MELWSRISQEQILFPISASWKVILPLLWYLLEYQSKKNIHAINWGISMNKVFFNQNIQIETPKFVKILMFLKWLTGKSWIYDLMGSLFIFFILTLQIIRINSVFCYKYAKIIVWTALMEWNLLNHYFK